MATTTPNFGWPVPTSTDLVKDGATAIEALGDSIDASLLDLKGGTSGQVLAKNSNTDMDFVWVTDAAGDITGVTVSSPLTGGGTSGTVTVGILSGTTSNLGAVQLSDSTSSTSTTLAATANSVKSAFDTATTANTTANAAIPKSTVTTAGDVIYATGSSALTRLGIGTAGQVLKVNAGATAPEWGAAATASGLVYLGATTFTAAASTSIDSVFSSTYQNYLVMLNISNGSGSLTMNFRASAADNTTANYSFYNDYMAFGTSWSRAIINSDGNTSITFNQGMVSSNVNIPITIMSPNLAEKSQVLSPMYAYNYNTTGNYTSMNTGFFNATTQFDGIKFTAGTSMTGTLKIYGIANS
jgi:hypothetical protein